MINATNGNFLQSTIPISFPFPVHHSHSRSQSHEFSLRFPFFWDSHGNHGNSRIMHTSNRYLSFPLQPWVRVRLGIGPVTFLHLRWKCSVAIPWKCPILVGFVRQLEAHQGACSLSQSSYLIWWTPSPCLCFVICHSGWPRLSVMRVIRSVAFFWILSARSDDKRRPRVPAALDRWRWRPDPDNKRKWVSDIGSTLSWATSQQQHPAGCRSFTPAFSGFKRYNARICLQTARKCSCYRHLQRKSN